MIIEEVIEVRDDEVYGVYIHDTKYGDNSNGFSISTVTIEEFESANNYKDFEDKIK